MNKYNLNNELILLLGKFPNKNWDYFSLSQNPNITIDYIKYNSNKDWNYSIFI